MAAISASGIAHKLIITVRGQFERTPQAEELPEGMDGMLVIAGLVQPQAHPKDRDLAEDLAQTGLHRRRSLLRGGV